MRRRRPNSNLHTAWNISSYDGPFYPLIKIISNQQWFMWKLKVSAIFSTFSKTFTPGERKQFSQCFSKSLSSSRGGYDLVIPQFSQSQNKLLLLFLLHSVLKPTWPGFSIVHNALNCTALTALIKSHISNLKFTHKLHDIMHKLQYSQDWHHIYR